MLSEEASTKEDSGSAPVLSVHNLTKAFSDKTVVDDVSFDLHAGEILALVGENGAGKSTTKNMLCGLLKPTAGSIEMEHAQDDHGVVAVHQELSLFPSLTVAENMCITELPGQAFNVNWKQAERQAAEQLSFLGIDIDPQAAVESLGAGKQQIVEIAKALMLTDKVLILDEPTTSLTAPEREKLFTIMRKLKQRGVAMIFISHFMDEVYEMADTFIVLRDGKQVGSGSLSDVPRAELEALMVGRPVGASSFDLAEPEEERILQVEKLSAPQFDDISFDLRKGEILGLAGLMGSGRTEVAEAIFGIRKSKGDIFLNGRQVAPATVGKMKRNRVCYVTEDRRSNGIFPGRSVKENLSAAGIGQFAKRLVKGFGFRGEKQKALRVVDEMNVSIPHIGSAIRNLSGGNQQKVLLGRWLSTNPDICILDEPTKGVDIGAKFDIHSRIVELAKSGKAVIVVSSDLPELLDISHRIIVMRTGHKVGEFKRGEFDSVKIIALAASSVHETAEK